MIKFGIGYRHFTNDLLNMLHDMKSTDIHWHPAIRFYANGTHNLLSRQKMSKLDTFEENIQFPYLCFGGQWHNENSEGNWVYKLPYYKKYSKITNISCPKVGFYSFVTIFSKLQAPQVKYLPESLTESLSHWNIYVQIEYFPKKKLLNFCVFCQDNKSWVPFEYNLRYWQSKNSSNKMLSQWVLNRKTQPFRLVCPPLWAVKACATWDSLKYFLFLHHLNIGLGSFS